MGQNLGAMLTWLLGSGNIAMSVFVDIPLVYQVDWTEFLSSNNHALEF